MKDKLEAFYDFWFNYYKDPLKWIQIGDKKDNFIRTKYQPLFQKFIDSKYYDKSATITTSKRALIGAIILCDQIPRHIFRGSELSYFYDNIALKLAKIALESTNYRILGEDFVYVTLPFQHSLDIRDHDYIIQILNSKIRNTREEKYRKMYKFTLKYAILHRDTILRFGSFPKRKAILGQTLTNEEETYLKTEAKNRPF